MASLGFFTNDQDPLTPEGIERQRRLADAMMKPGPARINHWTQGLAQVLEGGVGAYKSAQADKAEKANQQYSAQKLAALLGGGSASPMGAPTSAPAPSQAMTTADASASPSAAPADIPPQFLPALQEASAKTGIPVPVLAAKIKQESGFNPNARGQAGEVGLAQIMPSTARQPGFGMQGVDPASLSDPAANINFGAQYLAARGKAAGVSNWNDPQQVAKALTAYNGGGDPNYAQNVMRYMPGQQAISGQTQPTQVAQAGGGAPPMPQGGGNARALALAQVLSDPRIDKQTKAIAGTMLAQALQPSKVRPVDLGGSIGFADERGNIVRTIQKQQGQKFGPIGQDQFGNNQYGFIDERNGKVTPANPQAQAAGQPVTIKGPGGRDITVPEGMNPKIVRDEISKRAAGTIADAPAAVQKAQESLALIDQVIAHPGREFGTGMSGIIPGIPGTAQNDFITLVDQLGGRAFLEAFESLKGGGQITEMEGRKATEAMARLKRTQSEEGFLQALKELRGIVSGGLQRAKANQGGGAAPQAQTAPAAAPDAPPAGVEPQIWKFMTPEERALWK